MTDPIARPTTTEGLSLVRLIVASDQARDALNLHEKAVPEAEGHRREAERLRAELKVLDAKMEELFAKLDPDELSRAARYAEAIDADVSPDPDDPSGADH